MTGPQASLLPGDRLHLHHGPIDLIVGVDGPTRMACYAAATERFAQILPELVEELPALRRARVERNSFVGPVAKRMSRAVRPYQGVFVTPMAAVAGSVADEIIAVIVGPHRPPKAFVNNGGDIAFHLNGRSTFSAMGPSGKMTINTNDPMRGIATSGWRGRSHSRGIADAVTVLAPTAAAADVAATLIANAVDLPDHPAIRRTPASDLSPDSDLGERYVTTDVGALSPNDVARALCRGHKFAKHLLNDGLIFDAILSLQGTVTTAAAPIEKTLQGTKAHA